MTSMPTESPVVLIVEDERNLADLYAKWVRDDYDVRTAYDGETALEELDDAVDVVLLDRRMPGLSGDAVLDRIREGSIDCRVAMVTAVKPDFDILELGFDDYLSKPASKDDLHAVVEELLARASYDQTLQEYYALVAKRATLRSEKRARELANNDRYQRITDQIEEYEAKLDLKEATMDRDDYDAAFRDLEQE